MLNMSNVSLLHPMCVEHQNNQPQRMKKKTPIFDIH